MVADRRSSVFWLALSLAVMHQARGLGLGSLTEPGSGFLSFWAALLLAVLSVALLARSVWKKEGSAEGPLFRGTRWPRLVAVFAALLAYVRLLERGGYLLTTFVLLGFLFWLLERRKPWQALGYSVATTAATYVVFGRWLNCQFPTGPLGF